MRCITGPNFKSVAFVVLEISLGLHLGAKRPKRGYISGQLFWGYISGQRGYISGQLLGLHLGAKGLHIGAGITSRGKGVTYRGRYYISGQRGYISGQVLHLGAKVTYRGTTAVLSYFPQSLK